jgi:hypothetical protein
MKIVSGPYCGRCKIAKQILSQKGYVINEIMANSDEGKEIIDKTTTGLLIAMLCSPVVVLTYILLWFVLR